ncbi:MAG: signal peptidase I [bacterium]|nr:signal peptidase I [bacterium]
MKEEEIIEKKKNRKKQRAKEEEKPLTLGQEILQMSIYLLIVLCVTFLLIHYVGQRTRVQGDSMRPTLHDGDNLMVDKLSYRFTEPQRYDIIVFPYEHKAKTYYIKRIIGLPGERVRIDQDGTIYINGEVLHENYGAEVMLNPGRAALEITLGADEYFVLGDNRNNSSDSRDPSVGNIHRDRIIGKAWVRIWPLSDIGFLKHQ